MVKSGTGDVLVLLCTKEKKMLSIHNLGIELVCVFIVKEEETVEFGWVPEDCMYQVLDAISEDGKYDVFATKNGGRVVDYLPAVARE